MHLIEQDTHPRLPLYCEIPLSNGGTVKVDVADYPELSRFKWWSASYGSVNTLYAARALPRKRPKSSKTVLMHRQIMGFPNSSVDHIDGDGLNCQRSNLRLANKSQNGANRPAQRNNTSGYKGVHKFRNKWHASIEVRGKEIYLGLYKTPEDAFLAYSIAAKSHFGEFARVR